MIRTIELPPTTAGRCGFLVAGTAPCLAPASWHYRLTLRGKTRTMYACLAHHDIALPASFDHHRVTQDCGVPGSEWVPRTPGESFCHSPDDTTEQLAQLTRSLQTA